MQPVWLRRMVDFALWLQERTLAAALHPMLRSLMSSTRIRGRLRRGIMAKRNIWTSNTGDRCGTVRP
jgi:hypothetical protein